MASGYNFGAKKYVDAFANLPVLDVKEVRKKTIEYVRAFEKDGAGVKVWKQDPVVTMLCGRRVGT